MDFFNCLFLSSYLFPYIFLKIRLSLIYLVINRLKRDSLVDVFLVKGGIRLKRWRKWIDAIFSIALFLSLFCTYFLLYDYGKITAQLGEFYRQEWFFYFLTTVSAIAGLFALFTLIRVIVLPSLNSYVVDKDENGEMLITSKAVENNILTTVDNYNEVKKSDVDVRVNNGSKHEISAKVTCGVREGIDLSLLSKQIKRDVSSNLEELTGYSVTKVDVEFYNIKEDSGKRVV